MTANGLAICESDLHFANRLLREVPSWGLRLEQIASPLRRKPKGWISCERGFLLNGIWLNDRLPALACAEGQLSFKPMLYSSLFFEGRKRKIKNLFLKIHFKIWHRIVK